MSTTEHNPFRTVKDAKEFLASRIAEEAQRVGIALTDVERKMLFFSESGWTLPDMADVNDEFDRDHNQREYEDKITKLIRSATHRARKDGPDEYKKWAEAVRKLSKGDHYIQSMTSRAGLKSGPSLVSWKFTLGIVAVFAAWAIVWSVMYFRFHMVSPRGAARQGTLRLTTYPTLDKIAGSGAAVVAAVTVLWGWILLLDRNRVVADASERFYRATIRMFKPRNSANIDR
jgi:hypothetical protein